jgi:SHS family lactate transporter-like MFS transporter
MKFEALTGWTARQKHAVTATYLAWTLDTLDYFVLVFVLADIAKYFHASPIAVAAATTLTLAFRPVGAFLFGRLADRFGRRPVLMANIAFYSLFGAATAFSFDLTSFLVIRALFGVAMGGIWGIGASLAMETIKPQSRGFVSGLLQSGYPTGYLLASLAFAVLYADVGWRGMFLLGLVPAVFVIAYIFFAVPESPGWKRETATAETTLAVLRKNWKLALYAFALMTAFNFFSHGTQDIYPRFLSEYHHFDHTVTGSIAIIYNFGAMLGGIIFGSYSQVLGRKRTIRVLAAASVPLAFFWAYAPTATLLAISAFLMQFCVQGAWGVIPAHLNELSPKSARGTFPGTVYQVGNLIASVNLPLQMGIVAAAGGNFSVGLLAIAVCAGLAIAILISFSPENKDVDMKS